MSTTNITTSKSILILEDDVRQADVLELALQKSGYQHIVKTYLGVKAIEAFDNPENVPDIALLDIALSGQPINGIEVGKKIMQLNEETIIIYLTAYPDDENFEKASASNPHAFIAKPYQIKRLNRTIEMAVQQVVRARKNFLTPSPISPSIPQINKSKRVLYFSNFLLIKNDTKGHEIIDLSDLLHLSSDGSYTHIHLKNKKYTLSNYSMTTFDKDFRRQETFDEKYACLVRIHRSHIVNLAHIEKVDVKKKGGMIYLKNGEALSVSMGYVAVFWSAMERCPKREE